MGNDTSAAIADRKELPRVDLPLLSGFETWLSDQNQNISRPKILFIAAALDFLIVLLIGLASAWPILQTASTPSIFTSLAAIFVVAAITVAQLASRWAYTIRSLSSFQQQVSQIVVGLVFAFATAFGLWVIAGFSLDLLPPPVVWLAMSAALIGLIRFGLSRLIGVWRSAGRLVRRAVIVGGGEGARLILDELQPASESALRVLGIFDDREGGRSPDSVGGIAKLGNFDALEAFCRKRDIDLLIVTVPASAEARLMQILKTVMTVPVEIRVSALGSRLRLTPTAYRSVEGIPMLPIMDRPLNDWDRVVKNLEDRILGALLLAAAAPLMALIAIAVKATSRGPVFFKQHRYGFNNELIEVYKFRSMYVEPTDETATKLVTKSDPRVTRVGAFLRKSSLDELPQLINVVLGQMSLVGPRPHARSAKAAGDLYQDVVDTYGARHRMKPGITGWAQINGWRGETDTREKLERRVEYDLDYINRWSVWFDLFVIIKTPIALLTGKNAY